MGRGSGARGGALFYGGATFLVGGERVGGLLSANALLNFAMVWKVYLIIRGTEPLFQTIGLFKLCFARPPHLPSNAPSSQTGTLLVGSQKILGRGAQLEATRARCSPRPPAKREHCL